MDGLATEEEVDEGQRQSSGLDDDTKIRGESFCDCFSSMDDMDLFEENFTPLPNFDDILDIPGIC